VKKKGKNGANVEVVNETAKRGMKHRFLKKTAICTHGRGESAEGG